jgi:hypothetical protein
LWWHVQHAVLTEIAEAVVLAGFADEAAAALQTEAVEEAARRQPELSPTTKTTRPTLFALVVFLGDPACA